MSNKTRDTAIIWLVTIGCIVCVSIFAVWWHKNKMEKLSDEAEVVPVNEDELRTSVDHLFQYNGFDTDNIDLSELVITDKAKELSDSLIYTVNTASDTHSVVVPIADQNLLFVPAPSVIWIDNENHLLPTVFISANESEVQAYDPTSDEIVIYPFTSFQKMYDKAGRQCVYIAPRGYDDY